MKPSSLAITLAVVMFSHYPRMHSSDFNPNPSTNYEGALKLAICNDIGEASYDRVVVAAAMCDRIIKLSNSQKGYVDMRRIIDRCASLSSHDFTILFQQSRFHDNFISRRSIWRAC